MRDIQSLLRVVSKSHTPSSPTKYTAEHESVAFDGATGLGTIAITDHAQQSLGDVVFVDLPTIGSKISKGGESRLNTHHVPKGVDAAEMKFFARRNDWCRGERQGRFGHRLSGSHLCKVRILRVAHVVCSHLR